LDRTPRHAIYALINNLCLILDQNITPCVTRFRVHVPFCLSTAGLVKQINLLCPQNNSTLASSSCCFTPSSSSFSLCLSLSLAVALVRSLALTISLYLLVRAGSGEIMNLFGSREFFSKLKLKIALCPSSSRT